MNKPSAGYRKEYNCNVWVYVLWLNSKDANSWVLWKKHLKLYFGCFLFARLKGKKSPKSQNWQMYEKTYLPVDANMQILNLEDKIINN